MFQHAYKMLPAGTYICNKYACLPVVVNNLLTYLAKHAAV